MKCKVQQTPDEEKWRGTCAVRFQLTFWIHSQGTGSGDSSAFPLHMLSWVELVLSSRIQTAYSAELKRLCSGNLIKVPIYKLCNLSRMQKPRPQMPKVIHCPLLLIRLWCTLITCVCKLVFAADVNRNCIFVCVWLFKKLKLKAALCRPVTYKALCTRHQWLPLSHVTSRAYNWFGIWFLPLSIARCC